MRVLTINCGSSTLKFQAIDVRDPGAPLGEERRIAEGLVERIGRPGGAVDFSTDGQRVQEDAEVPDHGAAFRRSLEWLNSVGLAYRDGFESVGHRVVHGGGAFFEATLIDDAVIGAIESLTELAPLHNQPSLNAIQGAREALGPDVPMVAVFDTAFHHAMPQRASLYAIPPDLAERHQIRRYGFHGLAHRYMAERYPALSGQPLDESRLITLQLGNGCSATAVDGGRSVDTSMGLTPLEGLVMGTRSGDVDPSLAGFLARKEGVSVDETEDWLNTRSGLLGVSGRSRDMRNLLEAERQGDARASLAVEMFCYRARKYVGAYLAALGGADAVVFGGGIGENSPEIRAGICQGMEWCGLALDDARNRAAVGSEGAIGRDGSRVQAYVTPVDEGVIIARDAARVLAGQRA